jgi:hypothetical protein
MYAKQDYNRDFKRLEFSDQVRDVPLPSWTVLHVQPLYGEPRMYWAVGHSHQQAVQHCQQGVYECLMERTLEAGPLQAHCLKSTDYRTVCQDRDAREASTAGIICIIVYGRQTPHTWFSH